MSIRTKIAERSPDMPTNPGHRMSVVLFPIGVLMLVMFMIRSFLSPEAESGVNESLSVQQPPVAGRGKILESGETESLYHVQIAKDGTVTGPAGVVWSPATLSEALNTHFEASRTLQRDPALRIRMDPECDAGALRQLLNAAQGIGYENIYFRVAGPGE